MKKCATFQHTASKPPNNTVWISSDNRPTENGKASIQKWTQFTAIIYGAQNRDAKIQWASQMTDVQVHKMDAIHVWLMESGCKDWESESNDRCASTYAQLSDYNAMSLNAATTWTTVITSAWYSPSVLVFIHQSGMSIAGDRRVITQRVVITVRLKWQWLVQLFVTHLLSTILLEQLCNLFKSRQKTPPPTYHTQFVTGWMPYLSSNKQCLKL